MGLLALLLSLLQARFHAVGNGGLVGQETHCCSINSDVAFLFRELRTSVAQLEQQDELLRVHVWQSE